MSNIYIQEPPTSGKVILVTTKGEIEVELWCKEAPKACRNFIQLCMEGYYNNTTFHRIIKGFIIQGGDPSGTGNGGDSIYGAPFKDEFHQRLRFNHRGLLGCASSGANDNTSQFFITLDRADELTNKHTVFGKVAGNTIFNVMAIGELPVGEGDRPEEPPRIIRTEVLNSYFEDIMPRNIKHNREEEKKAEVKNERKVAATKNFSLISFGDEAEEEEIADSSVKVGKMKSQYDVALEERRKKGLADEDLEAKKRRDEEERQRKQEAQQKERDAMERDRKATQALPENLRESHKESRKRKDSEEDAGEEEEMNDEEYDAQMRARLEQKRGRREERTEKNDKSVSKPKETKPVDTRSREQRLEDLKKEAEELKKEMRRSDRDGSEDRQAAEKRSRKESDAAAFLSAQREKYSTVVIPKKKESREEQTLALLSKFKSKLQGVEGSADKKQDEDDDSGWMAHRLVDNTVDFSKGIDPELDPSTLDLHDPRNPLNIRKRSDGKHKDRHRDASHHKSRKDRDRD